LTKDGEKRERGQSVERLDIVIVGAGLSGVGAACHLQSKCPQKTIAIIEARDAIGGTWDLFRYPGVRSDSDMPTFGYAFRPWDDPMAIADGPSIARYIRETASHFGANRLIRFGSRLIRASWHSPDAAWTLEVKRKDGSEIRLVCSFLYMCTGYYRYSAGYMPGWPGMDRFAGRIVHPQAWPDNLDFADKHIVVIGSGATAVTLVPALAETAAHVTMLQRSPTFVVSRPAKDPVAEWLSRRLPRGLAHRLARWKNILLQMYLYSLARRKPDAARAQILKLAQDELGPEFDAAALFNARYNPWDQRLCLVPDGDLFRAIRSGKASVVTGEIETFTERGLRLRSTQELEADMIVTATGLVMRLMGGAEIVVDGGPVDFAATLTYKGVMYSGIPNLASAFGYTNASWTLKCDLSADYMCRLLNHMDRRGYAVCTPRLNGASVSEDPTLPLTSGYIVRARNYFPKQGSRQPWRVNQNYALDLLAFRFSALEDGALEFRRRERAKAAA
jgi:cation diffusion facilitator CzcD-associated flavoprotein CzcO